MQGGEIGVLRNPDITRHKGSVHDRKIVARRGEQVAIGIAQAGGGGGIGAIHHRAIKPAAHIVGGGGRFAGNAGEWIDYRAGHADRTTEHRITTGHGDIDVVDPIGEGQVNVVVNELAPGIHHAGESLFVGGGAIAINHHIADRAGVGQIRAQGRDAVTEMGRAQAAEVGAEGI